MAYCLLEEARKGIQQEVEEIPLLTRKFIGETITPFFYGRRTGKSMMSEPSPGPLCKPIILIRPSLVTKKKPPKKSIAEQP